MKHNHQKTISYALTLLFMPKNNNNIEYHYCNRKKNNRINPANQDEITRITNVHDSGQPMNPISIKICNADSCAASSLPTG